MYNNAHLYFSYGCSLGGSFVGLLVQRGNIHIDHAVLGSSDLDQDHPMVAKLKAVIITPVLYGMFQKGKLPGFTQKWLEKKSPKERFYYEKMMDMFGMNNTRMSFVQKRSIRNQFYSDLITPLQKDISCPETTIHCFYAVKIFSRLGFVCQYQTYQTPGDGTYGKVISPKMVSCESMSAHDPGFCRWWCIKRSPYGMDLVI